MRVLKIVSYIFLSIFIGCSKTETSRNVEFWSNIDISTNSYKQLVINGRVVGTFEESTSSGICGAQSNLDYNLLPNSISEIHILNEERDSLLIGKISLGEFSAGISIDSTNSAEGASISIDGTSNDDCTTIKLIW